MLHISVIWGLYPIKRGSTHLRSLDGPKTKCDFIQTKKPWNTKIFQRPSLEPPILACGMLSGLSLAFKRAGASDPAMSLMLLITLGTMLKSLGMCWANFVKLALTPRKCHSEIASRNCLVYQM